MASKKKKIKAVNPVIAAIPTEHLPTESVEVIQEDAKLEPVASVEEPAKTVVPEKIRTAYVEPKVMLEEIAATFKKFKPSTAPAIRAFAISRGLPVCGTKAQMLDVIRQFGWKE